MRDQFLTILHEVTTERNAGRRRGRPEARQAILDAGGKIRELTPEQRQAWVDAMKPVWDQFADEVGQDNIDAAQAINDRACRPLTAGADAARPGTVGPSPHRRRGGDDGDIGLAHEPQRRFGARRSTASRKR